ncbi:hypothetical protein [Streptomyces sp. NPDC060027]|uniref:hypothetical protein n=1 Tax=Streptomyces sp. NPDC060027 TaxID=3347040 RepID=UPI0036B5B303
MSDQVGHMIGCLPPGEAYPAAVARSADRESTARPSAALRVGTVTSTSFASRALVRGAGRVRRDGRQPGSGALRQRPARQSADTGHTPPGRIPALGQPLGADGRQVAAPDADRAGEGTEPQPRRTGH